MKTLKLSKKYNDFSSNFYDSVQFEMYMNDEIGEEEALKRFTAEFQFSVDGFSNKKTQELLIERFKNN